MTKCKRCVICLRSCVIKAALAGGLTVGLWLSCMFVGWLVWQKAISEILKDCSVKIPSNDTIWYSKVDNNDKFNTTPLQLSDMNQNHEKFNITDNFNQSTRLDLTTKNEHLSFLDKILCHAKSSSLYATCVILIMIGSCVFFGIYLVLCFV